MRSVRFGHHSVVSVLGTFVPIIVAAQSLVIQNAGLGCGYNQCVWVQTIGVEDSCKVNLFKPDWSSTQPIATVTQPNCSAGLVTFEIPPTIRVTYDAINFNIQNKSGSWSEPRYIQISPHRRFSFSDSGYRYSSLVGMFARLASLSPTAGSLAWSSSGNTAIVHFGGADQYYEVFELKGNWMTLTGWGNKTPYGDAYYQIYTTSASIFVRGTSHDLTPEFSGGGHPYAIEKLPAEDYSLYVEAKLIQYMNWQPTGQSLTFSWYVDWGRPMIRPTMHFGTRLGIFQSERWIDSVGNDSTQAQVICEGVGYACWRKGSSMPEPDGTSSVWTW